jgi:hypothetical protein
VNDLKLRASIGQAGSESGVSMHGYLGGYDYNSGGAMLDGSYVAGLRPRGLPVTNLSWIVNTTTDIGFDAAFLNSRLTATVDGFTKELSGIPASRYDVVVPSEAGYTLPNENLNTERYYGMEGIVTWKDHVSDLNYVVSANATYSRRMIIETYKPRFTNSWNEYRTSSEGRWAGVNWGQQVIGRFQSMEEIKNYPVNIDGQGNSTLLPGDFIYKDVNGDGIINDMDQRPIGYGTGWPPYMSFGSSIYLEWKGISLNLDFAGGTMQTWVQDYELKNPLHNGYNSPAVRLDDRWHLADPYDPSSGWVEGYYPAVRLGYNGSSNWGSDFWVHNVTYLRLKNIELGYTLPTSWTSKIKASKVRIYANCSNVFSIDNVKQFGIDPEIAAEAAVTYPSQRLFLLGANITF